MYVDRRLEHIFLYLNSGELLLPNDLRFIDNLLNKINNMSNTDTEIDIIYYNRLEFIEMLLIKSQVLEKRNHLRLIV